MKRFIALAVVLVPLIALPVYAQQSGLTLESLSTRIDVLFSGQQYLTHRIAALETAVAISSQQQIVMVVTATPIPPTPLPTATQQPPTQTYTPVPTLTLAPEPTETATMEPSATPRPTFTPTPASARVTSDRRLSLRRGPGNSHSIVAYVEVNNQFEVIGRNIAGSWIQVNYNGKIGWLPARYAKDVDSIPIVATPTPLPKNTVAPTRTPVPTATTESISQEHWEILIEAVRKDMLALGYSPTNYSEEQIKDWAGDHGVNMITAMKKCRLSFSELAEIIEENAQLLDETGIPKREEFGSRWDLVSALAEYRSEDDPRSCLAYTEGRRRYLIDYYEKE